MVLLKAYCVASNRCKKACNRSWWHDTRIGNKVFLGNIRIVVYVVLAIVFRHQHHVFAWPLSRCIRLSQSPMYSTSTRRKIPWSIRNHGGMKIKSPALRPILDSISLKQRYVCSSRTVCDMMFISSASESFETSTVHHHRVDSNNILVSALLEKPEFWSAMILLSIVGLLWLWETLIEQLKEESPSYIHQVIDAMLAEMGGIGFIGLFLSTLLHNPVVHLSDTLHELSEEYLGNEEILLESFEFLHDIVFQTAVVFFAATAMTILLVVATFQRINEYSMCVMIDDTSGQTSSQWDPRLVNLLVDTTTSNLPKATRTVVVQLENNSDKESTQKVGTLDGIWIEELTKAPERRGAEAVLLREYLIRDASLSSSFDIDKYLIGKLASDELDIVSIAPTSWLPFIPIVALSSAIDLSRGIVDSGDANAVASSGCFLGDPVVFIPTVIITTVIIIWGISNYWKMAKIKSMLIPQLIRDNQQQGAIVAPAYKNEEKRKDFFSTTWWMQPFEAWFSTPSMDPIEELFGTIGGSGPRLYGNSIKFQSWGLVGHLVVVTAQVVPRDISAWMLLHQGDNSGIDMIGIPELVGPEILAYMLLALLVAGQLVLMNPISFFNYSLIRCAHDMIDPIRREKSRLLCTIALNKENQKGSDIVV